MLWLFKICKVSAARFVPPPFQTVVSSLHVRKGEVFAYVGLAQTLKGIKDPPHGIPLWFHLSDMPRSLLDIIDPGRLLCPFDLR